jgi:dUTP pyrophosphatase
LKLTEHSLTPTQEAPRSAGFELRSQCDTTVPSGGKELINSDLQIKLPAGYYGRTAPMMDLIQFHLIDIEAGLVDEDFPQQTEYTPFQSFRKTVHCFTR